MHYFTQPFFAQIVKQFSQIPGLRFFLIKCFGASLFACGFPSAYPVNVYATDVAVFFALDADLQTLQAGAKPLGQPVKIGSRTVQRLELGAHRVYAVKMGSGAVETAVSATALLTRFHCDVAFSVGPVGAIDDALSVGQWCRVETVVPYQRGSWDVGGFQPAPVSRKGGVETNPILDGRKLPALLAEAKPVKVASGELFVASSSYRMQLAAATGAQAVDMNLFGLETVCADQGVPLQSWRVVSDRADDQAGAIFRAFVASYGGAGGHALAETIAGLPASINSPETYPELRRLLSQPAPVMTPLTSPVPNHPAP